MTLTEWIRNTLFLKAGTSIDGRLLTSWRRTGSGAAPWRWVKGLVPCGVWGNATRFVILILRYNFIYLNTLWKKPILYCKISENNFGGHAGNYLKLQLIRIKFNQYIEFLFDFGKIS